MSGIKVQVNNGEIAEMPAPVTVADALKKLDRDLAKQALAARVNGREVDLAHSLESQPNGDAVKIEPVLPQTLDGLDVLRHSTAHLLAAAVLDLFPDTKLGIGPALLEDPRYGFFYDVIAPRALTEADLPIIEKKMRDIAKRNMPYRRDEIPKAEALRIFNGRAEPLKCELIDEKAGETVSVYYIDGSPFIDFCLGPHVPNTNKLKAFKLLSLAGAYWKGDAERPQMQRIYGTAFFTQEELDAWLKQREEAEKRDHRKLGRELDLFRFRKTTDRVWFFGIRRAALCASRWKIICVKNSRSGITVSFTRPTSLSASCGRRAATSRTTATRCLRRPSSKKPSFG